MVYNDNNSGILKYIFMKLGSVTKLDKKNTTTSKTIGDDVKSIDDDVIAIFQIYDLFRAIQKLNSRHMVYNSYTLINRNFLSYKNWKQNWIKYNTALLLLPWVKVVLVLKGMLSKAALVCVIA